MTRTLTIVLAVVALAGCSSDDAMNKGLTSLIGENIHSATARLGSPESKSVLSGYTIYAWRYSRNTSIPFMYRNTAGADLVPTYYSCAIQIATDTGGTIKGYKWSGTFGGCDSYASTLTR